MDNEKITHLINDEKENKQKTKKNNIVRIILIVVSCIVLVMSILFNSYYMYRLGYEKGIEIYKPLYLQNEINKPIKKADINYVPDDNIYYYPSIDFTIYVDINTFLAYEEQPLVYFVDNSTYLYFSSIDDQISTSVIRFWITNGIVDAPIITYDYNVDTNYINFEFSGTGSDGYLHYFITSEIRYTTFYSNYMTDFLVRTMPNYSSVSSNVPELITIGGSNGIISYDNGYNAGVTDTTNNILNNPNNYGLYTEQQYIDRYNQGVNYGVNSVNPDLASNGFITLMNVIFNAPYNIFNGFLNFEIFGVNLFNLLSFVFTTSIALFVVRLIFLKK